MNKSLNENDPPVTVSIVNGKFDQSIGLEVLSSRTKNYIKITSTSHSDPVNLAILLNKYQYFEAPSKYKTDIKEMTPTFVKIFYKTGKDLYNINRILKALIEKLIKDPKYKIYYSNKVHIRKYTIRDDIVLIRETL